MKAAVLGVAALAIAMTSPATAQESAGLAPSSSWMVDYANDSCALRRMFGEGDEQVFLEFRRFSPIGGLQTTVAPNWTKAKRRPQGRYRFGSHEEWREAKAISLVPADGFSPIIFSVHAYDLPETDTPEEVRWREAYLWSADRRALELETAAQRNSLTVRDAFRDEVTLDLGPMDAPMAALQTCTDELMGHWGIDVDAHRSLTRPAWPTNLDQVMQLISYPPEMIRMEMPGLINLRLSIAETGDITDCRMQMPLSDPAFEQSTCARFHQSLKMEPALDKNGKPIASFWTITLQFSLT